MFGQPATLEHEVQTPQIIVEDADQPPAKQALFTFTLETPLGKRYYSVTICVHDPNSPAKYQLDERHLPESLRAEYATAREAVERAYSSEMLSRAKRIIQELPFYQEPSAENIQVHQVNLSLAPKGMSLPEDQQKWVEAVSTGIEIFPPYLDRQSKTKLHFQVLHLPGSISDFIEHTSGTTLMGYLTNFEEERFALTRMLETLSPTDLAQLLEEYPDIAVLKDKASRAAYEQSIKKEVQRQLEQLFTQDWSGVSEDYLRTHIPEGVSSDVWETAMQLKSGYIAVQNPEETRWPYVFNGKRYRLAPMIYSEIQDRTVSVGYHIYNDYDGVLSTSDGAQRLVPPTKIQRDKYSDPIYPGPDDRDRAEFSVPFLDENNQPLLNQDGEIVRAPVYLSSVTTHWEGDSMRGPRDTGARSSTDTFLRVIAPNEVSLQLALDTEDTERTADESVSEAWSVLAQAELPESLRNAVASKNLEALITGCVALDHVLDTDQKVSQGFRLVVQLLRTVDPQDQRDWGFVPEDWMRSHKSAVDRVRRHITDHLQSTDQAKRFASDVRSDLIAALDAVQEKIRVEKLRKEGYLVNEIVKPPVAEPGEQVAFAYLHSDGTIVKSREIFVNSESKRLYREIPPSAIAVFVTVERDDAEVHAVTINLAVPQSAVLSDEQLKGVEQLMTDQIFQNAAGTELSLAKLGTSLPSFRKSLRELQPLLPGKLTYELLKEDEGVNAYVVKGDDEREVAVPQLDQAPEKTADELLSLIKVIEKALSMTAAKAETRSRLQILAAYLRNSTPDKQLALVHALVLDIAKSENITVPESAYEVAKVSPPSLATPSFSSSKPDLPSSPTTKPEGQPQLGTSLFSPARATLEGSHSGSSTLGAVDALPTAQSKSIPALNGLADNLYAQLRSAVADPKVTAELARIKQTISGFSSTAQRLRIEADLIDFAKRNALTLPEGFTQPAETSTATPEVVPAVRYQDVAKLSEEELKALITTEPPADQQLRWRYAVAALASKGFTQIQYLLTRRLSEQQLQDIRAALPSGESDADLAIQALDVLQSLRLALDSDILNGMLDEDPESRERFTSAFSAAAQAKRKETQRMLNQTEIDALIYQVLDGMT